MNILSRSYQNRSMQAKTASTKSRSLRRAEARLQPWEAVRLAVHQRNRTAKDYDAASRETAPPADLLPTLDTGDLYHPNDLSYKSMADAIDFALFR